MSSPSDPLSMLTREQLEELIRATFRNAGSWETMQDISAVQVAARDMGFDLSWDNLPAAGWKTEGE